MADNQIINFNSQDVADMYRRNQYARMLQEQAAAPIERSSYKGIEAPIHPTQVAAKVAAAALAQYQQYLMDKSYSTEKSTAEQKLVAERDRRKAEVAEYAMGEAPTTSYGYAPSTNDVQNYAPQSQMTSTPKSQAQLLAQRLTGMGSDNELIRNMARTSIDQQNAADQEKARVSERAITREDMLAGRAQTQQNYEGTQAQNQRNADKQYNLQLEKLKQDKLPSKKEQVENNLQETAKDNVEATLKRMDANYKALRDIGGMRTQTGNPLSNLASAVGSSLPYAAQGKKESLLRESLDSDLQSLVMPAMKASGMTSKQMDTPSEVARYMRTLGGTNISYEGNQPILERLHTELVGRTNNPFSKDSRIKSVMDMYAPKGK